MRIILYILLIAPSFVIAQFDSTAVILERDEIDIPKTYQKVYSPEEETALANYGTQNSIEVVALQRELYGAVNSNDMVAYHVLKVNFALVKQYDIKKVSFYSGKQNQKLIAWISFDSLGTEIDRYVKNKYQPYTGDYSELCLYKHNDPPFVPSTKRLYRTENNHKLGFLEEFIWKDAPLYPVKIQYKFYD